MRNINYKRHIVKLPALFLIIICLNFNPLSGNIPQPLPEISVSPTGKPGTSIPIRMPQAVQGMLPSLSLMYSSSQENGLMGVGWHLSGLDSISRDTFSGIHFDSDDIFASSLAGQLQLIGAPGIYHSKNESFMQFQASPGISGPSVWMATVKNGRKFYYGESGAALLANGNPSGGIKEWGLSRAVDLHGNEYRIFYTSDSQTDGVLYPDRIEYNGGVTVVRFTYGNRDDTLPTFQDGGETHLRNLLTRIAIDMNGATVEDYSFDYEKGSPGRYRLKTINRAGFDPLNVSYTTDTPSSPGGFARFIPDLNYLSWFIQADGTRNNCTLGEAWCLCSAFPLCLPGLAQQACAWFVGYFKNDCHTGIGASVQFYVDVNGDARTDFVRITGPQNANSFTVNYINEGGISASAGTNGSFALRDESIIFPADINGDFRTDFVVIEQNGSTVKTAISTGSNPAFNIVDTGIPAEIAGSKADRRNKHFAADLNGDGRADFIQYRNGGFFAHLSTGVSFDGGHALSVPSYGIGFQQFADMDGDGLTDFFRVDQAGGQKQLVVTFFRKDLSTRKTTISNISYDGTDGNRFLADVNGDRKQDFIVFQQGGTLTTYSFDGEYFMAPVNNSVARAYYVSQDSTVNSGAGYGYAEYDINRDGHNDRLYLAGDKYELQIFDTTLNGFKPSIFIGSDPILSDINNDGQQDQIWASDSAISVKLLDSSATVIDSYSVAINRADMLKDPSMPIDNMNLVTNELYNNWRNGKGLADVDGDGKSDFIRYSEGQIFVSYARVSGGNVYFSPGGDLVFSAAAFQAAGDINGDGRADFLGVDAAKHPIEFSIGIGPLVLLAHDYSAHEASGNLWVYQTPKSLPNDLLTAVTGSYGKSVSVTYSLLSNLSGAINYGILGTGPIKPNIFSDYATTSSLIDFGNGLNRRTTYSYQDARLFIGSVGDRKSLGFASMRTTDETTGRYSIQFQNQTTSDLAMTARRIESYNSDGSLKSSKDLLYSPQTSIFGTKILNLVSTTTQYFQNGNPLLSVIESNIYDSYGNTTSTTSSYNSGSLVEVATASFSIDTGNWILDRATGTGVTVNGTLIEQKKTFYNSADVTEEHTLVNPGVWSIRKFLAYDSYGNPVSIQDPMGNVTHIDYDPVVHTYPVTVTNALGQQLQTGYDYNLGLPLTITNPNGGILTKSYDRYGRVVEIIKPGESSWSERFDYVSPGDPANDRTVHQIRDDVNGTLESAEYHDAMGRTYRKDSDGMDGHRVVMLTDYNSRGEIIRTSDTFLEGVESPRYTVNEYNDPEGKLTRTTRPDGTYIIYTYSGYTTTSDRFAGDGTQLGSATITQDIRGNELTRTIQGQTLTYAYDAAGRVTSVTNQTGGTTTITYNIRGDRLSITDPDAGTITSVYNLMGKLISQTDARGNTTTISYDQLGRPKQLSSLDSNINYEYDTAPSGIGQLARVQDNTGVTSFKYNLRGIPTDLQTDIDGISFLMHMDYDSMDRLRSKIYPDGTRIQHNYSGAGYLASITMDSADGSSYGQPVVVYGADVTGPLKLTRTTGNGVKTEVDIDPVFRRANAIRTTLPGGTVQQNWGYVYDNHGNVVRIDDNSVPTRTQTFGYDSLERNVTATGKYGTENYNYDNNGNLTQRGLYTLTYGDPNHRHAVTTVYHPNFGTINYQYDAAGNLISRGDESFSYDSFNRLHTINKPGETLEYIYNFGGRRVKTVRHSDGLTVYNFGDLYEIERKSGQPDKHTLYIRGYGDEVIAQITRTDSILVTEGLTDQQPTLAGFTASFCQFRPVSCSTVLTHSLDWLGSSAFVSIFLKPNKTLRYEFIFSLALAGLLFLFGSLYVQHRQKDRVVRSHPFLSLVTPVLIIAICLGTFSGCVGILPGQGGDPPWIALPSGVNNGTPSIDDPSGGAESGGVISAGSPATGMYFYHPDHLGSTRMITGGNGQPVAGGEYGGASDVNYRPYGEINRTDSGGPDIFRYKYTGQQEDRDSGLLFYKSRYYDPAIGRFLQPDNLTNANDVQALNPYMYVEGNPVSFADPGGHKKDKPAWLVNMYKDWCKAVIQNYAEQSLANASLVMIFGYHQQHEAQKKLERMRTTRLLEVVVVVVVAVVVCVVTDGAGLPAVAGAVEAAVGGTAGAVLGYAVGVIGYAAVGYAIGSVAGYVIGGISSPDGQWSEERAVAGMQVGGAIGAAIGASLGGPEIASQSSGLRGVHEFLFGTADAFSLSPVNLSNWGVIQWASLLFNLCTSEYDLFVTHNYREILRNQVNVALMIELPLMGTVLSLGENGFKQNEVFLSAVNHLKNRNGIFQVWDRRSIIAKYAPVVAQSDYGTER